jgi:hypothetical protein
MKGWRSLVASAALASIVAAPGVARAEEPVESAGWGVLAVLGNLVYMPAKTVYALVGGLTGGLAYVCTIGSLETASEIWDPSLGGTYVLTPAMIRGEQPIQFVGGSGESSSDDGRARSDEQIGEGDAPEPIDTERSRSRNEEALPAS